MRNTSAKWLYNGETDWGKRQAALSSDTPMWGLAKQPSAFTNWDFSPPNQAMHSAKQESAIKRV
jgi:hypothetical protein